MRAPAFWWQEPGLAARLLAPFAAVYGAVAARRLARPGASAGIPVVCVGNLTVGGAGKTPTALAVARLLIAAGERPVLLSRGYGGRLAGPVVVDPATHRARDTGDEPLLLARVAPTVVARDRVAGARMARERGNVVVMDDGFQNPSLAKNLSILVVDGRRGVGNRKVIPAGPLRAPLGPQLDRAQAVLVIGEPTGAGEVIGAAATRGLPVFRGRLAPDRDAVAALAGTRVLAYAGIGDPDKFFAMLDEAGFDVRMRRGFGDHHRYGASQASALLAEADRLGLIPLTTEKDLVRLRGDDGVRALAERSRAVPVTLVVDDEKAFADLVVAAVRGPMHQAT